MRSTYCNPPQKHIVAGGSTEGEELFCVVLTGVSVHVHHREDESFYVLQGEFMFVEEDSTISAGVGSLIYVPKGTLHAHKNVGEEVGRMLLTQTPGGLYEGFLEEAARPGTGLSSPSLALTPEEVQKMGELGRKYGIEYPPPSVW